MAERDDVVEVVIKLLLRRAGSCQVGKWSKEGGGLSRIRGMHVTMYVCMYACTYGLVQFKYGFQSVSRHRLIRSVSMGCTYSLGLRI